MEQAILSRLQRVGERFVANARGKTKDHGGFGDVTGNLRSSIGYLILKSGKQLTGSNFETITTGGEGSEIGKRVIEEIAQKYPTGIVLICVSGMSYSYAVESKGKDVISGSSLIAMNELKAAMQEISRKAA